MQVCEISLPEHRDEIVLVGGPLPRPLDDLEELDYFALFESFRDSNLANAILIEEPCEIVRRLSGAVIAVDRSVEPANLALGERQQELVRFRPDRREPAPQAVNRAAVNRIVREIELMCARSLGDEPNQLLDRSRGEWRLLRLRLRRRTVHHNLWGCHEPKI